MATSLFCCICLICHSLLFLVQTDCAGLGLMLYQSFPHLLNAHFVTQHQLLLSHLVENSCKKPQTVSLYRMCCGRYSVEVTNHAMACYGGFLNDQINSHPKFCKYNIRMKEQCVHEMF